MKFNFTEQVRAVPILTHGSGTADRTSEVIDTRGYARCCIVVHFAAVGAGVQSIKLQHSETATDHETLDTPSDVATSAQVVAATDDNRVKFIEIQPTKRYVQLVVDKDATNATDESAVAYLYMGKRRPSVHAAGGTDVGEGTAVAEGEFIANAIDGTA